jgi:hypothetical protein
VTARAVGLRGVTRVVHLEARAHAPDPGIHRDVAAVPIDVGLAFPPGEARLRRVEVHVRRVGPLVVALLGPLDTRDRRVAAVSGAR